MKLKKVGLLFSTVCMMQMANADVIYEQLLQNHGDISITLKSGDVASINYNLERSPITRASVWYSYAMTCNADDKAEMSYLSDGQQQKAYLPILIANADDRQEFCTSWTHGQCDHPDIDEEGTFEIKNLSGKKEIVECHLHHKFGL